MKLAGNSNQVVEVGSLNTPPGADFKKGDKCLYPANAIGDGDAHLCIVFQANPAFTSLISITDGSIFVLQDTEEVIAIDSQIWINAIETCISEKGFSPN